MGDQSRCVTLLRRGGLLSVNFLLFAFFRFLAGANGRKRPASSPLLGLAPVVVES
jgi:hypothetical protein